MSHLTGRTRLRSTWWKKLVLQVQYLDQGFQWRDAQTEDLCELQHLIFSRIDINVRMPDLPADFEPPRVTPTPSPTKH